MNQLQKSLLTGVTVISLGAASFAAQADKGMAIALSALSF